MSSQNPVRLLARRIKNRIFPRQHPTSTLPRGPVEHPALRESDVKNARLFAEREALVEYLAPSLRGGTIAELGVMYGDFSDFLIRTLEPKLFVAFDIFTMHTVPIIWGQSPTKRFHGLTTESSTKGDSLAWAAGYAVRKD